MRPNSSSPASLSSFASNRFSSWLLAVLLAFGLVPPVAACMESDTWSGNSANVSPSGANLWIEVNGEDVMFKFRGFRTVPPTSLAGNTACACGLRMVSSLKSINSRAEVMMAGTNTPVSAFDFKSFDRISSSLHDAAGSGTWAGFETSAIQSIPANVSVDLIFRGKLKQGETFASLKASMLAAGNVIGFGKAAAGGDFSSPPTLCETDGIDRLGPAQAAPLIKVGKITMEHPRSIELVVRDAEEGLATLRTLDSVRAMEISPSFTAGTTAPVLVDFTIAEGPGDGAIGFEACNVKGECTTLRVDIVTMTVGLSGLVSRDLSGVARTRSLIKVQNGTPGATMFVLTANGQRFSVRPMLSNQSLDFNAPLALTEEENAVTLALRGTAGGEAMVLMMESQPNS